LPPAVLAVLDLNFGPPETALGPERQGAQFPRPSLLGNATALSNRSAPPPTTTRPPSTGAGGTRAFTVAAAGSNPAEGGVVKTLSAGTVNGPNGSEDRGTALPRNRVPSGGGPASSGGNVQSGPGSLSSRSGDNVPSASDASANPAGFASGYVSGVLPGSGSTTRLVSKVVPGAHSQPAGAAGSHHAPGFPTPPAVGAVATPGLPGTQHGRVHPRPGPTPNAPTSRGSTPGGGPVLPAPQSPAHANHQATVAGQVSRPAPARNTGIGVVPAQGSNSGTVQVKDTRADLMASRAPGVGMTTAFGRRDTAAVHGLTNIPTGPGAQRSTLSTPSNPTVADAESTVIGRVGLTLRAP
jgi:hypothetical protein